MVVVVGIKVVVVVCLFDLILNVPVNSFSVMLGLVFMGLTSTKQGLMNLLKDTTQCRMVRLEPATPRSRVKHFTTALSVVVVKVVVQVYDKHISLQYNQRSHYSLSRNLQHSRFLYSS